MTLRERRIENEWMFLLRLAAENSSILQVKRREKVCGGDWFYFSLHETGAIDLSAQRETKTEHDVSFHFPEFFPAVPIEAFVLRPVFHPNVHPHNGFVCLWNRFSRGDSVLEAVRQLQRVISWELFNAEADHLMQPEALEAAPGVAPLEYSPVEIPDDLRAERAFASPQPLPAGVRRQRLS